jgi:hypothetical protein
VVSFFARATPEARFWKWFKKNSLRLFTFEANQDAVFASLDRALKGVHEGLTFEFGPVENGRREFIVSADGIKTVFPAVTRLVEAAPPIREWKVIPFRPPKSLDYEIEIHGCRVGADDVWFDAEEDRGKIGLRLYVRGFIPEKNTSLGHAAFLLLDNAVGEYVVEMNIGFIELHPLPADPAGLGLKPFRSIRSVPGLVIH